MEKDQNQRDVLLNQQHYDPPPSYQQPSVPVDAPSAPIFQPVYPAVPANYTKQDDHLGCSIFNLLCCTMCLGIPALIFSVKAREQFRLGRNDEALSNAGIAKKLNIAGISIGVIIIVLIIILEIVALFLH